MARVHIYRVLDRDYPRELRALPTPPDPLYIRGELLAKPLMPSLPPAVLAADQTQGPSASIGSGKNCYKNPFPVAAPVILTLKATKGGGPAGAQVYSK